MPNTTAVVLPEKRLQQIIWTLLCLMPIMGMTVDLIAPSLPAIASGLRVSTSVAKDVITVYLIGYALGNFFTGFLTDAFGRQKLIRISLFGFALVSLLPVFFPTIAMLLLARFLQGLTIGAVSVLVRATFSDILPPDKLTRLGPTIGAMWGVGPVIGPVIGGYLQVYLGWRAGFCFFALVAILGFIATFIIVPETHFARHPLNIRTIKTNFMEVIKHRKFMAMVLLMGLTYSLVIVFNTIGPFLIQTKWHYSPIYFGHLALCLGIVFITSTFVCRYFLKKHPVENLLFAVINLFFAIAIIAIIASYFFSQSTVLITIASALMFFASGFIFPISMSKGISFFRHIAGTATATMYLINILTTSLTAFVVSFIDVQSVVSMMWIYGVLLLLCMLVYWAMVRRG